MNTNLTELVFILDRSGSMSGLESDTIGGYNGLLEKQRKEAGEVIVTTVLFDDRYELLHDRTPIAGIAPITANDYYVRGSTALLDAMGQTIDKIVNAHKHTQQSVRPAHVLFAIITDGMENASRVYTAERVKAMVEMQKAEFGWEFLFLGANIDAVQTAARYGIARDRAVRYEADPRGTQMNFEGISRAACCMRKERPIEASWKASIEKDYEERGRK